MQVEHWNEKTDGPFSESIFLKKLQARGYNVTRYVYPPGTYFPDHTHEVDKIDGVVSGRFRMTTKKGTVILEAGDALYVPRGTIHSAEALGDEPVVSLDAIRVD